MQSNRQAFVHVYVIAVAFNYPWELAQSALFTPASHKGNVWLNCFIASLGDGVMVLLLLALGWLAFERRDWFVHPRPHVYGALAAAGLVLGGAVEWVAVHVLERWTYTDAMPRVPVLEIGVVPILQMVLLPALIFQVSARALGLTGRQRA
jgi:hypothetical protein